MSQKQMHRVCIFLLALLIKASIDVCAFHNATTQTLSINPSKEILGLNDQLNISISVNSKQIDRQKADAHVILRNPKNKISILYKVTDWTIQSILSKKIASIEMHDRQFGPFDCYFILCEPGKDVVDTQKWIAASHFQSFLMPDKYLKNQRNLRALDCIDDQTFVAHACGNIGQISAPNTLEALNYNYNRGYRYFEVDLNWTKDNHLVLIHDWEQSYHDAFNSTQAIPTYDEFINMKMLSGNT